MIDVDWQGAAPEPDRRPPTLTELVDAIDSTRAAVDRLATEYTDAHARAAVALALYRDARQAHDDALEQYRLHRTQAGIGAEQP